ncbi:MAG: TadE/TadG family type IV pilus assembly protein [Chloroflexota bacterium]
MISKDKPTERGQAIVMIVLAMVVLLGFTALAIDGAMVYSDRRFAQSGADSASLAGAGMTARWLAARGVTYNSFGVSGTTCTGDTLFAANKGLDAAVARAGDNDAVIDKDPSDGNGVEASCGIEAITSPTAGGSSFTVFYDKYIEIRTTVTRQTQTAFAHFVYSGEMQNTVTSVTRIRPPQPLAFGYAIVALNPNGCSGNSAGVQSGGSLTGTIIGGGVFTNGCMDHDGNKKVKIYNGSVAYFYGGGGVSANYELYDAGGNLITTNRPLAQLTDTNARIPLSAYDVPMPNCDATGAHRGSAASLLYGRSGLSGLYCIDDGNGIDVHNAGGSFSGTDMTIVVMGGNVTLNGGSVSVQAPADPYTGPAIAGVALYLPTQYYGPSPASCGDVNQEIKINGNNTSNWNGSILAPCSDISLEGGSITNALKAQVIGWNVNTRGNANLFVDFSSSNKHTNPSTLDLFR